MSRWPATLLTFVALTIACDDGSVPPGGEDAAVDPPRPPVQNRCTQGRCLHDTCCAAGDVTALACGTAGGVCEMCDEAERCVDGACAAFDGLEWRVIVVSGHISSAFAYDPHPNNAWTEPDPFVHVTMRNGLHGRTSERQDTHRPCWVTEVVDGLTREELLEGFTVEVWDGDIFWHDHIATIDVVPTDEDLRVGSMSVSDDEGRAEIVLAFR